MAIDFNQLIQTALESALQGQSQAQQPAQQGGGKRKHKVLTGPRALLLGAGAFTAGRLLLGSRGRDALGNLQERLAAFESEHLDGILHSDEAGSEDDDEFDEEPEGQYDEDEEPEGEYDEDEEPEGEYDEDEEPEGEYDEDEEPEDEERPRRRRRTSAAGSRNGRH